MNHPDRDVDHGPTPDHFLTIHNESRQKKKPEIVALIVQGTTKVQDLKANSIMIECVCI